MKTRDAAVAKATALAEQMGYGWKVDVWENLGWQYCVKRGALEVHPATGGGYHCYFNAIKSFVRTDNDPRTAKSLVLGEAWDFLHTLERELEENAK